MRYGWVVAALALGLGGCMYAGDGYDGYDSDTVYSSGDYHNNDRDEHRHHDRGGDRGGRGGDRGDRDGHDGHRDGGRHGDHHGDGRDHDGGKD